MISLKTLDELTAGKSALISGMGVDGGMRHRMQDIGFLDGVMIKCLFRGTSGEPAAFLISGAVIALRRDEMRKIRIKPFDDEELSAESAGCASWV